MLRKEDLCNSLRRRDDPISHMASEQLLRISIVSKDVENAWRGCHRPDLECSINPGAKLVLTIKLLEGAFGREPPVTEAPPIDGARLPVWTSCNDESSLGVS